MIKHNPGNLELIPFGHAHVSPVTIDSRKYYQRTGAARNKGANGPQNSAAYSNSAASGSGGSYCGAMGGECEILGSGDDRATGYLGMSITLATGEYYLGGLSLALRTLDGNEDPRYIYRVGGHICSETQSYGNDPRTQVTGDNNLKGIAVRPWLGWRYEWENVRDTDRARAKVVIHQYLPLQFQTIASGSIGTWSCWIQDMNGPAADIAQADAASDWPSKPSGGGSKLEVTEMVMGVNIHPITVGQRLNAGGSLWFDRIQGVDPGIINMPV